MSSAICQTCELIQKRDAGEAPLWDSIYRSDYWDVVHAFNVSLPGWLVLVIRRHIAAIDQMTETEAVELGKLIRATSIALKQVTGCEKTYIMQFAESADHPHVHFHIVPRMADQPEDKKGPKVFGYMAGNDAQHVPEETMNILALGIKPLLISILSEG